MFKKIRNIKFPKITIFDITLSGSLLALIVVGKGFQKMFIPALPGTGYSGEIGATLLIICLYLLKNGMIKLLFVICMILIFMVTGLSTGGGGASLGLDGAVPLFAFGVSMSFVAPLIAKMMPKSGKPVAYSLAITLAFTIKFFSNSLSGVLLFDTPGVPSMVYNILYNSLTGGITIFMFVSFYIINIQVRHKVAKK